MDKLRNNSGYRIQPLDFEPTIIFTRSDCSALRINEPLYTEDNAIRYTLAAIDVYGTGHNMYHRLVLIPEIAAD